MLAALVTQSTAHRPPVSVAIWNRPAHNARGAFDIERRQCTRTHRARLDNVQGAPQVVTPPPPWLMGSQDRPCRTASEYWLHSTTVLGTVLSRNRQLEGRMVEMENSGTSQQAPRRPYWGVMARAPLVTSLSHTSAEENWKGRGGT